MNSQKLEDSWIVLRFFLWIKLFCFPLIVFSVEMIFDKVQYVFEMERKRLKKFSTFFGGLRSFGAFV